MMIKRKKITNKWHKFFVVGLVILTTGSVSLQSIVALGNNSASNDKKVKNEIEEQKNSPEYAPGQVIIKFKEGESSDYEFLRGNRLRSVKKVLKENKSGKNVKAEQAIKKHGLDRIYLAEFSPEENLTGVLERLNRDSRIEYAEPNYEVKIDVIPDDPDFNKLWGLHNTGQTRGIVDADIDAPEAWNIEKGSSDVVIAVIDTGVDYNHPDLAANIWTNSGETAGNGIDDDGNGFIDDVYGYNFYNDNGNPMDDHNHGTHCAGTIGAVGDKNGIVGVNWTVKIMPIKFLGSDGSGSTEGAIASVQYAITMGVDVMSNSWGGGGDSQALEDAILAANDAGILFVAAAGNNRSDNDRFPHYPSNYEVPNVISVAATDHKDRKASFSNYGLNSVDLGAPGVSIYSTVVGDGYATYSGTSMACPHVAGVAGLIKAQYPELTSEGLKTRLLSGVDLISSLDGKTVTGGRLNAYNSLNSVGENLPPTANAGTDQTVYDVDGGGFEKITLDGSGSSDPEGGALSYEWKEGDTVLGNGILFLYDFSIGTHIVILTVTDDGGSTDTDEVIITVTGDVVVDEVIVEKALYDSKKQILTVEATSTSNGVATLTMEGLEENREMSYNADWNLYFLTTGCNENPGTITVSSDLGGSAEMTVVNKFKER